MNLADEAVLQEFFRRKKAQEVGKSFIGFAKALYPWLIVEAAHVMIGAHFEMLLRGEIDRLILNLAPRAGKSILTSELLPLWWMGHFPSDQIIHASYAMGLVEKFGRKVRNSMGDPVYQGMFPKTVLSKDSKAAAQFATTKGGVYNAVGIGGGVAGKGFQLAILDDPVSEQDMFSKNAHDAVYDWYQSGLYTRRQPTRNALCITMCMTGDTPVLMASGVEKPLRDIRPMDEVATYENGVLATTRVLDWRSSGIDSIYTVSTRSGRILRANERHPFLTETNGERKWVRLHDLKVGDNLVLLKDVVDLPDQRQHRGCVRHVSARGRTTKNTLMHLFSRWDITGSGKTKYAVIGAATNPLVAMDCVRRTMERNGGRPEEVARLRSSGVTAVLKDATELPKKILMGLCKCKTAFVRCVESLLQNTTPALIGTTSYASITTTQPIVFADSSATTATSRLAIQKPQQQQRKWQDIFGFTTDPITNIVPDGQEEVFDVEIERTENFIANGVVSKNTRWRTDDLSGRLLDEMTRREDADKWVHLKIPAVLDEEGAQMLNRYADDPAITNYHHYAVGDSFSPERWSLAELNRTRSQISRKAWYSLYEQSPTEEDGSILLRKYWQAWPADEKPPLCEYLIQSYDTAFETEKRNDFSARTTWGVFEHAKTKRRCVILLEAMNRRLAFPELRQNAWESYRQYRPNRVLIEKAASGHPLVQELRTRGVPVTPIVPKGSKESRAHSASVPLEQGAVYFFESRWANEVIDQMAAFPNSAHDDVVDAACLGLNFLRRTYNLDVGNDRKYDKDVIEAEEIERWKKPQLVRSYAHTRMQIRERRYG